jgi:hypothetical protein
MKMTKHSADVFEPSSFATAEPWLARAADSRRSSYLVTQIIAAGAIRDLTAAC